MKNGKKVYDFTKVLMEIRFGEFEETDISKSVGNAIHQNTGDLGIDEIARKIHKTGKAEMTDSEANVVSYIIEHGESQLVIAAKNAAIDLLTNKKLKENGKD